jgi:hypothetical protein
MNLRIFFSQGLIAALVLLFCVAPSAAATHMGVAPAKHLVLQYYQNKLYKITPLGKRTEFGVVPAGNALVITDINWEIYGSANKSYYLDVSIIKSTVTAMVFRGSVKTDGSGDAVFQQSFTSGLVVGPGFTVFALCWGATTTSLYLQGYLTPYP